MASMQEGACHYGRGALWLLLLAILHTEVGAQTCLRGLVDWPTLQCTEPCPVAELCSLQTLGSKAVTVNRTDYCCMCVFNTEVNCDLADHRGRLRLA